MGCIPFFYYFCRAKWEGVFQQKKPAGKQVQVLYSTRCCKSPTFL